MPSLILCTKIHLLCEADAWDDGLCDIRIPCSGFCVFCNPDNNDVYGKKDQ